eukprot:2060937-Rhodomonas_salina.1
MRALGFARHTPRPSRWHSGHVTVKSSLPCDFQVSLASWRGPEARRRLLRVGAQQTHSGWHTPGHQLPLAGFGTVTRSRPGGLTSLSPSHGNLNWGLNCQCEALRGLQVQCSPSPYNAK